MKSTRLSTHGFQEISLVWYVYLGSISVLWELVWIWIWDFFWKSLESSQTECPLLQKHTECTNIFQRNPISLILKSTRGFLANKMYFLPTDPEKKKFYQTHFEIQENAFLVDSVSMGNKFFYRNLIKSPSKNITEDSAPIFEQCLSFFFETPWFQITRYSPTLWRIASTG